MSVCKSMRTAAAHMRVRVRARTCIILIVHTRDWMCVWARHSTAPILPTHEFVQGRANAPLSFCHSHSTRLTLFCRRTSSNSCHGHACWTHVAHIVTLSPLTHSHLRVGGHMLSCSRVHAYTNALMNACICKLVPQAWARILDSCRTHRGTQTHATGTGTHVGLTSHTP